MSGGIEELIEESVWRSEDGDPSGALALARRATRLARRRDAPHMAAGAHRAMARALYDLGRYRESRAAAETARSFDLVAQPGGHAVGEDDILLGLSALMLGDAPGAVRTLSTAVTRLEATLGPDDRQTIEALNDLAAALAQAGHGEQAEALGREALARCDRSLGAHRQTAVVLNSLAVRAGRDPSRAAEAVALSERAIEVAGRAFGPDHPFSVSLAANVAIHRTRAGDPDGPRLLRQALVDHERAFGPDHPNLAFVLTAIADASEDPAEARWAIGRAALIRLRALGPTARPTLETLHKALARFGPHGSEGLVTPETVAIYRALAALDPDPLPVALPGVRHPSPKEAAASLGHVLERFLDERPMPGELREAVACDLATADDLAAQGQHPAAVASVERVIGRIEAARGPDSPDLIGPLRRLAAHCRASGEESRSLAIAGRIADIAEAAYGQGHPLSTMAIVDHADRERHEYGALSQAAANRVITAAQATFGLEAYTSQMAARLFESPPDQARREVPLSVARAEALRTLPADGPLSGLDEVDWRAMGHALGPATDTPGDIRLLRALDPDVRSDALDRLAGAICHQGSVSPAAVAATPFLVRLALEPGQPDRESILWLLVLLAGGLDDGDVDHGRAVRQAMAPFREMLLALGSDTPGLAEAAAELARVLDAGRP